MAKQGVYNPDGYNFIAYCEQCKEPRSVSGSRRRAVTDEPVIVGAIYCGHSWTLTPEQKDAFRKLISGFVS